jgi:4-carboxymuconolactone decarboxylase
MRIEALTPEKMNAAQRSVHDEAAGGQRGHAPVPLTAWIRSPALARHAQRLSEAIRFDAALPPRIIALAALTVAAHWRAPYVWSAQEKKVVAAGIARSAIDAIANRTEPALTDPHDAAAYRVVHALQEKQELDDATYAVAIAAFGEQGLVELVATAGYYTMVSMTLKTFQIDAAPPAGASR